MARIQLADPTTIVDLGCGTGTSTSVLRERWSAGRLTGVDSSPEMLERARASSLVATWVRADLRKWAPTQPVDLLFSNAALQWIPDHTVWVPRLLARVAPGGALAVQVPTRGSPLPGWLEAVAELRRRSPWNRLEGQDIAESNVLALDDYYALLAPAARRVDLWETSYHHVLPGPAAIVEWVRGTGLRPLLGQIGDPSKQERFLSELEAEVARRYRRQADGTVIFPFPRRFFVAYR